MDKIIKRALCMVMMLAMSQVFTVALAEEYTPFNTNISLFAANLTVASNGTATVSGSVKASSASYSISATLSVLQYKNGKWATYKSWPTESGKFSLKQTETCSLASGYKYKAKYNANVQGEKRSVYSAEKSR
ncbi:MAG: hypothetical protein VB115_08285 [Christensenellaceae bacterium]|nr:hypothetical protein [Christensenellaceae bacterium]